ncbi:MAG: VWA domain-containing protein [Gammaproteobacteria bacterium]|nr:VWA domain-containing protein [Gammaproteobacteria bacterium]
MMQMLPDTHPTRTIAAAAVVLFLAGTTSQASALPLEGVEAVVQTTVELDRPLIVRGDRTPVCALVRFHAAESPLAERANRPPLNLALVLDRSGSMEATGKIVYLKEAASKAVDGLTPSDHLAVVEYDTEITTLWPSQPVLAKESIKRLIDRLTPRGGTDLAAGMMRGVEEVAARMQTVDAQRAVSRVLLLSDGLANHGVTHAAEISGMVREAKRQGVRISTLGLGLDYGEDLMQAIAQNGGGAFYHVEHPHQIARIYQEELAALSATVAKDARLRLEAAPGVVNATILGVHDPQQADLDLGSFHAGETHTLLAQFVPGETLFDATGEASLGGIAVSYHDLTNDRATSVRIPLTVKVVEDEQAALAARNPEVAIETKLFVAERRHRDAVAQYQAGRYDAANQAMRELEARVRQGERAAPGSSPGQQSRGAAGGAGPDGGCAYQCHSPKCLPEAIQEQAVPGGNGKPRSVPAAARRRGHQRRAAADRLAGRGPLRRSCRRHLLGCGGNVHQGISSGEFAHRRRYRRPRHDAEAGA